MPIPYFYCHFSILHKCPFGIFVAILVHFPHYGLAAPVSRLRSFVSHQKIPPPPLNIPPGGQNFHLQMKWSRATAKKLARRILSERRLSDWSKDLLEEASQSPMLARHKLFV
jgi:hypothetical protein